MFETEEATSKPAHLHFQMRHREGGLAIDMAFDLTQPWTVLFGPSGSGKSTILRAIAGLLKPIDARIAVRTREQEDDRLNVITDTSRRVLVAPHLRPVRWSGQAAALFPHHTVRENVEYGVANAPERKTIVDETMQRLRLNALAKKRSWELSGGEGQRVALARVIAASASRGCLLLLDEPFVGLDLRLRDELAWELRSWLEEIKTPVLSVTHDIAEAFLLEAEVIRIDEGRLVLQGRPEEVLAEERKRLVEQLSRSEASVRAGRPRGSWS